MRLALRRFRLEGIGPLGARFDPLVVDLRAGDAAARSAVLFLENGGGKSVLLRLLFAVILPGRRQTVGGARLDGYVLSGDTGHVVLEWETPSGGLLVTGLVLEWRGRQRSGSSQNLLPLWYGFSPVAGELTFDDLPIVQDGRRRLRTAFRERLSDLARSVPSLQLVIEDQPTKWREHLLRSTPLDPESFGYQRTMNADEADAESLFAGVRNDDGFVRFVIESVHDPDELDSFGELVGAYSHQLARRAELESEASFAAAAAGALGRLASTWDERAAARRELASFQGRATDLRASLDAGAREARGVASNARVLSSSLDAERSAVNARADRASSAQAELRRLEAVFLVKEAEQASDEVVARLSDVRAIVAAWPLVPGVLERDTLQERLERLRARQEEHDRDLVPLRVEAEAHEADLAARLRAEAASHVARSERARARGAEAQDQATASDAEARDASVLLGRHHTVRDRQLEAIAEAERAERQARDTELLRPGERPAAALVRWEHSDTESGSALIDHRRARTTAIDEQRRASSALLTAERDSAEAGQRLATARDELDRRTAEAELILAEELVRALVPGAEDLWAVGGPLRVQLADRIELDRAAERGLGHDRVTIREQLDALDTDGLLPPSADVRVVWEALLAAGIGATSGWQWLADKLDEEGRHAALARNAGVAGGVLVTDGSAVDEALRTLVEAEVEVASVVTIGSPADLERSGVGSAAPVQPALYDPAWTARTRARLDGALADVEEQLAAVRARLAAEEPLLRRLRDLLDACPPARRSSLRATADEAEGAVRRTGVVLDEARARSTAADAHVRSLDEIEDQLQRNATEAAARHRSAKALAEQADEAERARSDVARLDREIDNATRAIERATLAAVTQRRTAEECGRRADLLDDTASRLGVEADGLGSAPVADPPTTVSTEQLRAQAAASRATYELERTGRDLTPAIEDAEARLASRRKELGGVASLLVERAELLVSATSGIADAEVRRAHANEADRLHVATEAEARTAAERVGAAKSLLGQRVPGDGRLRHVVLDPADEPASPGEAATRADKFGEEFATRMQRVRELQTEIQATETEAQAADTRAQLLAAAAAHLPSDAPDRDDVEPWSGPTAEAQQEAERLRRSLDVSNAQSLAADANLDRAELAVRAVAVDPVHRRIGGVRVALAEEPVATLAPRAAVLADELTAMRASVEAELVDIERHREGIVLRLATLVEHHLGLLARLERLSRLPDDLGGWSRKPFLQVAFDRHDAVHLQARLEGVLDAAATEPTRRAPLELLLAGMRAAVHDGPERPPFRVSLLRPNRAMREERATVAQLDREFSGGMKLTAAICTYCTLAALRAGSRTTGTLFGAQPGPLFLDNPLGKASADYLLDLQHRLAEKLGVQLVHTTGVYDVEALQSYERFVRLRNLSDLRANVQRLRVDDGVDLGLNRTATGVDAAGFNRRRP